MKWEVSPPKCEATKDGHQCERDREPAHRDHWYTVWSHPNQYGSYPQYPARWSDAA